MSLEHIEVFLVIFSETSETGHVAFPENWLIWHGMTHEYWATHSWDMRVQRLATVPVFAEIVKVWGAISPTPLVRLASDFGFGAVGSQIGMLHVYQISLKSVARCLIFLLFWVIWHVVTRWQIWHTVSRLQNRVTACIIAQKRRTRNILRDQLISQHTRKRHIVFICVCHTQWHCQSSVSFRDLIKPNFKLEYWPGKIRRHSWGYDL